MRYKILVEGTLVDARTQGSFVLCHAQNTGWAAVGDEEDVIIPQSSLARKISVLLLKLLEAGCAFCLGLVITKPP